MRIGFLITLVFLLAVPASAVMIRGVGYPPIKAESPGQAFLMAKRAAILDAYRRAMGKKTEDLNDVSFYRKFSGFIKGAKVVDVITLSDGGVEVILDVKEEDIEAVIDHIGKITPGGYKSRGKPKEVSILEWNRIIEKYVRFESNKGGRP